MKSTGHFTPWNAACFVVLCFGALLYFPTLLGSIAWDDRMILDGSGIGGGSLRDCFVHSFMFRYFRPGVGVTFVVERGLWGNDIHPYRMTNLLIHLANIGAVIGLARAAFHSRRTALIAGLVFACQPAMVGSVAWVGGRTDTLVCLWATLFCWAIVRSAQTVGDARLYLLAGATAAYLLALFTKEQALFLPILIPAAYAIWKPEKGIRMRSDGWYSTAPFAICILLYLAASSMVTMPGGSPLSWTPGERLALVFRSVTYYVGLFVVPTPDSLHTLTMANLERAGSWTILGGAAITFLLLATFLPLVRKSGKTAWVVALIALTMAPVLNIIPLPFLQLAPYRGCLGAIGVALLWGVLFSYLTRRNAKFVVPLGAILCWYSYLTVWGGWQWRSEEVIFRRFLEVDPLNLSLRYNLVYTLRESKQYAASARELELQMQSLFGANNWDNGNRAFEIFERNNSIRRLIVQLKGNSSPVENWIAWQYSVLAELRIELKDFVGAQRAYLAAQKFNPTGNGVVAGLEKLQTLLNSHGGSDEPKN